MTEIKGTSPDKTTGCPKNIIQRKRGKPEKVYPLYWLAPSRDLGARLVRTAFLCQSVGIPVKHVQDSNICHYPGGTRIVKYVLNLLGMGFGGSKEPVIRVVKINGEFFVERGQRLLLLAQALKLDYIPIRIVEYSYEFLKRKMQIFKYPDLEIVGIAAGQKGGYDYQGVSAENANVLLKHHLVPLVDHTAPPLEESPGAPPSRRNRRRGAPVPSGKHPGLTVIKKKRK